jgi:hypothetical protein
MEVTRMHTVELLDEALGAARRLGYDVRQDWLNGDGGGHCLVRGRRLLLLDVAQSPDEQLDIVVEALRSEMTSGKLRVSRELSDRLELPAAA